MDKLVVDFPKARIVFQNDPIAAIHPQAAKARPMASAWQDWAAAPLSSSLPPRCFEARMALQHADGATLTLNSAVTKAGLDPAKIAACAAAPETKAEVDASVKLGKDLDITAVPDADDQRPPGSRQRPLRDAEEDHRITRPSWTACAQ